MEHDKKTGIVTQVGGFFPVIWGYLAEVLNFTSEWHVPADGAFGSKRPNGEWNGMIRMLLEGRIDLSICPFMMTSLRAEVVRYTAPLASTRASLFIRTPSEAPAKWEVFVQPFHRSLWLALAPAPALLAALLWAAHRPAPAHAFSAGHCALCLWGVFCAQGHSDSPGLLGARVVFLASFLTALVLLAGYTANFMAYLTAPHYPLPFTDLQGMLQDSSYSFTVIGKSGLFTNFQSAQDEVMRLAFKLHLKPHADRLPLSDEEAVEHMCAHRDAFMGNEDITRELAPCPLSLLHGSSFPLNNAMVLPRSSPYAFLFNNVIQALRRSGVLRLQYRKLWRVAAPAEEPFVHVFLEDVAPLLWLLSSGAGLALLVCAAELAVRRLGP
ncbi:Ionotropic receptor 25a, partial [Gryllus bimaculatus]